MPRVRPSSSTHTVGSTPGNRTKKMGTDGEDSAKVNGMENGSP